ncbi:MAG: hypothetical protein IPH57_00400 [Saprospiraceae bacterium]|nr:hypothetical protein [Saprospiraceae bacterium]
MRNDSDPEVLICNFAEVIYFQFPAFGSLNQKQLTAATKTARIVVLNISISPPKLIRLIGGTAHFPSPLRYVVELAGGSLLIFTAYLLFWKL